MIKLLLVLKRMLSSGLGDQHLHERSHLLLRERGLLQTEGLSHPGVHPIHLQGVVLSLLFVVDQIFPLLGVVTEDQDLQLEDVLLHLEGIGHQCGGVVAAYHRVDAPRGLLGAHLGLPDGDHHQQGG